MTRKRNIKAVGNRNGKGEADEEIEVKRCTSILDLPDLIITDVVLRLPIKAIIMCKCVCKPWRHVISDPQFAKMHFANAQLCTLIRTSWDSRVSRMLYLLEPSEIDVGYGSDYYSPDHGVNLKLDTKLKIPLRKAEMVPQDAGGNKPILRGNGGSKKRCMNVKTVRVNAKQQKFEIVNSCNGILCLSDPQYNNPLVVCNPVTGEYLNLPTVDEVDKSLDYTVSCGFGFSEKTNEYKVIRMFGQQGRLEYASCPITGKKALGNVVVEVHTIGSRSWRRICHAPSYGTELQYPTCTNGSLHWLYLGYGLDFIYTFDLGQEQFRAIQPPPLEHDMKESHNLESINMGVLKGCLCLSVGLVSDNIDIWVMEKYDEPKSWAKLISINSLVNDNWPFGVYQPLDFFGSKGLLMFQYPTGAFMYYEPETLKWKYFRIRDIKSRFEAVTHTPSLILLKDVVTGDSAEILNVNSRCNEFKLLGETKGLFLKKEFWNVEPDTDAPVAATTMKTD